MRHNRGHIGDEHHRGGSFRDRGVKHGARGEWGERQTGKSPRDQAQGAGVGDKWHSSTRLGIHARRSHSDVYAALSGLEGGGRPRMPHSGLEP